MKLVPLALALTLIAPVHAFAHDATLRLGSSSCDPPTRWAARHDVADARLAITTQGDEVTLILDEEAVALQLSDRKFHKVARKLRDKRDDAEDDGALGRAIKNAVLSSVREMLDHSIECPRRHIARASYEDGRLVLVTHDGDELFKNVEVDDRNVMESFSEADARRFVREFQRSRFARR